MDETCRRTAVRRPQAFLRLICCEPRSPSTSDRFRTHLPSPCVLSALHPAAASCHDAIGCVRGRLGCGRLMQLSDELAGCDRSVFIEKFLPRLACVLRQPVGPATRKTCETVDRRERAADVVLLLRFRLSPRPPFSHPPSLTDDPINVSPLPPPT